MSSNSQILKLSSYPVLEQISGVERGRAFEISGRSLSIGRSEENDICIPSEGISRNHAVIEITPSGEYMIRDSGSRNGIQVNGSKVDNCILQNGDVVRIGNLVFRYSDDHGANEVAEPSGPESMELAEYDGGVEAAPKRRPAPNRRVLLYGVVGLVLVGVLMLNNTEEAPKESKKEDEGKIASFDATQDPSLLTGQKSTGAGMADPTLRPAEQANASLDWSNTSLKESEQYFRKGQREYFNQNYLRAIEAFEAALNIYRGHPLAGLYLTRAKAEAEHEAKKNMEIAVRYFESLQYQRAIYHFKQVVALLAHRPDDPKVSALLSQCEKYIHAARERLKAAEMFP